MNLSFCFFLGVVLVITNGAYCMGQQEMIVQFPSSHSVKSPPMEQQRLPEGLLYYIITSTEAHPPRQLKKRVPSALDMLGKRAVQTITPEELQQLYVNPMLLGKKASRYHTTKRVPSALDMLGKRSVEYATPEELQKLYIHPLLLGKKAYHPGVAPLLQGLGRKGRRTGITTAEWDPLSMGMPLKKRQHFDALAGLALGKRVERRAGGRKFFVPGLGVVLQY